MIRPPDWKPRQLITAEKLQRMTASIRELQNKLPPKSKGGRSSGGSYLPPFHVSVFKKDDVWKYRVTPGYVTEQNILAPEKLEVYVPTLGGVSLEAETAPEGALPGVFAFIYVRVITNARGQVQGVPTIVATIAATPSTHHIPSDTDEPEGTDGDYYFLIAEFKSDGETEPSPEAVRRVVGNKNVPNQLVQFENVGDGKEIHKDYDPITDTHKLRTPKERGTNPQLKVEYSDENDESASEEIIIKGNNYDNSVYEVNKVSISVIDGLVTSLTGSIGGSGGDLNLIVETRGVTYNDVDTVHSWDPGDIGEDIEPTLITNLLPDVISLTGSPQPEVTHFWRDGIYIGDTDPLDGIGITQRVTRLIFPPA